MFKQVCHSHMGLRIRTEMLCGREASLSKTLSFIIYGREQR
jgi:hypothetical protein